MLTPLSQRVLDYIRCHPEGVKIATLEVMCLKPDGGRYPSQEIEAAVSQLKRANFITQRRPGEWMPATEGSIHVEREPDHARIRETGVVDRVEATPQVFSPTTTIHIDARADREAVRLDVARITQETVMAKQKRRTCDKCKQAKGGRAFEADSPTCRACKGTNKSAKPVKAAPEKRKLRAIVNRHLSRPGDAITAAIAQLEAEIYDRQQLLEGLRKFT